MPDAGASGGAEGAGGGLGDGTAGMGDSGYGGGGDVGGGGYGDGGGYGGGGLGAGDVAGTGLGAMDVGAQSAGAPGAGASGAQGIGASTGAGEEFSISQYAKGFFSKAKTMMGYVTNPIGSLMGPTQIGIAPNTPPSKMDAAIGMRDKQLGWGGAAKTVGAAIGSVMGPAGTALGGRVAELGGMTAASLTDLDAASLTTGPLGTHDPAAVANFNSMMADSQPGGGGSEGTILDEMRKKSGLPAISPATYQRPAIMSPQARAVYQNR